MHAVTLAWFTGTITGTEPSQMSLVKPVVFPATTSHNFYREKGLQQATTQQYTLQQLTH